MKIRTESFVHVGDQLVNTRDLTPEQKVALGTWLKTTYLNNLFAGKAEFYPAEKEEGGRADGQQHEERNALGDLA